MAMIPGICIEIHTDKFPILDGEKEELVNEGMYGKALCLYLQQKLPQIGVQVPSFCSEDWGWWIDAEINNFKMGLCLYSDYDAQSHPEKYSILSSVRSAKKWSWSKLRKIDLSSNVNHIMDGVEKVFREDTDIRVVKRLDDGPF